MKRTALLGLLVVAASALPGCGTFCAVFCRQDPVKSPPRATRDTPEEAIDFLIESFRNRRVNDIFESLHPAFVRENGEFTAAEFNAGYERYEAAFLADAESLAAAMRSPVTYLENGAGITVRNFQNGAEVTLWFQKVPRVRILTSDDWVPELSGPVDVEGLFAIEEGRLFLAREIDLTAIPGVESATVAGLRGEDVRRFEVHDDWLVRQVQGARNIQFLDKLDEYVGGR